MWPDPTARLRDIARLLKPGGASPWCHSPDVDPPAACVLGYTETAATVRPGE